MTPEDRAELERWRSIAAATPGRTARTLLDACNAIEAMQAQRDAEVKRLRAQTSGWSAARDIVERAVRKGYDIGGFDLDDLAEAFGLNGGEGR